MAVASDPGVAGSRGGVPSSSIRGYQSMRYSCETRYYYAEGYRARAEDSWRVGRFGLITVRRGVTFGMTAKH